MTVIFTRRAVKNYQSIRHYLINKWSERIADAFEVKTKSFLDLLEEFPEIGTIEVESKQIYGFQLTTQTKVLYRIEEERIIILSLFDVRQHPKKKGF